MKTICQERRKQSSHSQPVARGVSSVSADLDKLLGSKNLEELGKLETQIQTKLTSNEPIDTDYWEHLLSSLLVYKAKAKLRKVSQGIMQVKLGSLRKQQAEDASALRARLDGKLAATAVQGDVPEQGPAPSMSDTSRYPLDPEPLLRLQPEDKQMPSVEEQAYTQNLVSLFLYAL